MLYWIWTFWRGNSKKCWCKEFTAKRIFACKGTWKEYCTSIFLLFDLILLLSLKEYRELIYEDSAAPKKKYCELCQSLPTYGVSFFLVKEKMPGKNKLIPRLLGVNKESVMRVDERTKAVLKEWPLEQANFNLFRGEV